MEINTFDVIFARVVQVVVVILALAVFVRIFFKRSK